MKQYYGFRQGFEGENISLAIKLSVRTENMESKDVFRLIMALDAEYRKLEQEKCSENERKGFKEWQRYNNCNSEAGLSSLQRQNTV